MARLAGVRIGGGSPVRIMGVINASPESFHKGTVRTGRRQTRDAAKAMEDRGADFVDVGGMSTAPYLSTAVSERTESERVLAAIGAIRDSTNLPVSVDTCRSRVARDALEHGAEIVNDISGLKYDAKMAATVSEFGASLVLCAYGRGTVAGDPVPVTRRLLQEGLAIAKRHRIPPDTIALDPAVGFFRRTGRGPFFTKIRSDWLERDLAVLRGLRSIMRGRPAVVSASNKSFIGRILGRDLPEDRIFGSVAAEAAAVLNGAAVIRTHNVAATRDAIAVASRLGRGQNKGL